MRVVGIDPGTKTFDVFLLEDKKFVKENSIRTPEVAKEPSALLRAIEGLGDVDLIVGPSGYGAPLICNSDITDIRTFASEILLLTDYNELVSSNKEELGIYVYKALVRVSEEMWKKKLNVCYIPSVKLLTTVDLKYKLNRIDLGTADKLASAFYAINYLVFAESVPIESASFVLVELGFGYNTIIKVKRGKIVAGIGGTSFGLGYLTSGPLDVEIVSYRKTWNRSDVFKGGIFDICRGLDFEKALSSDDEPCRSAVELLLETLFEKINTFSSDGTNILVFTGRYSSISALRELLMNRLPHGFKIIFNPKLFPNTNAKEAAIGEALIGAGMLNGFNSAIYKNALIEEAKGTVLDYIYLPSFDELIKKHRDAYYRSVDKRKLQKIFSI